MTCPDCEYHKGRAQRWRDEAYKQAGHPLPEREWAGLTDEEALECWPGLAMYADCAKFWENIEAKLKKKNT